MIKKFLWQSARSFALLIFTAITVTLPTPAYPSWNNDMDGRRATWVGYGGSLYYVTSANGYDYVMRWSPGIVEDEQILVGNYEADFLYLTVHDGFLYAAGDVTNVSSPVSNSVDVHGIAKVDLSTLVATDAFSATVNPIPHAMIWDHNGDPYIGGIAWTAAGSHYEMNAFKKWSGSAWVTVGGGLFATVADESGVLAFATDGTNIYVGGTFLGTTNGNGGLLTSQNLVQFNVDTGAWKAMGIAPESGTIGWVTGLALSGTNVLAAGAFAGHDGVRRFLNPSCSSASIGVANSDTVNVITVNGDFYITGGFTSIGSVTTTGVAKWSNGSWSALGSGLNADAVDLTASANSIFVAGNFTDAGGLYCPNDSARWQLAADEALRFTSGSVSGTAVTLNLAGIANLPCQVQRLDFPSDTWVSQGTVTLNSSGTGTFNSSTTNGLGYFRARSLDGAYLSTNAFGSIVGSVPPGNWMVGNPFPPITTSVMFPTPIDGMTVYYYTNGGFISCSYDGFLGTGWSADRAAATGEGMVVFVPGGPNCVFQTYGLFYPDYFSRTLPTNYSLIASPLYHKLSGGSATQIDEFNSTRLGGYSLVPVNSSSNPKARADRNKSGVANQYIDYTLTTGGQWQTNSVNTTVPILIGEGLWIENRFGSSQNWSVTVPIW